MRSAGLTAVLKFGSTAIAFGASLIYARALGPHGYGLYAYVFAWAGLLTLPAALGIPEYLIREGGKTLRAARTLRRWADRWVLLAGLAAALIMLAAALVPQAAGARFLFVLAAPLPLLNALGYVRQSLLRTRGLVVTSQWPLLILGPGFVLAAIGLLWVFRGVVAPFEIIAASTVAAVVVLAVGQYQLRRHAGGAGETRPHSIRLRGALPFMWLGVLFLVNNRIDLIMLGSLRGAHAAGIYAVAARAAELVPFFLGVANLVIAPRIARCYHDGEQELLQRLVAASARRVFLVSAPLALLLLIAAPLLLRFLYGEAFAEGALALRILVGAQLVNVGVGSVGLVLNMTGNEKFTALGVGLGAVLNITLNAVLIPLYGIEGAAIATATSLIAWNLMLWVLVRRRTGLRPSAFGI